MLPPVCAQTAQAPCGRCAPEAPKLTGVLRVDNTLSEGSAARRWKVDTRPCSCCSTGERSAPTRRAPSTCGRLSAMACCSGACPSCGHNNHRNRTGLAIARAVAVCQWRPMYTAQHCTPQGMHRRAWHASATATSWMPSTSNACVLMLMVHQLCRSHFSRCPTPLQTSLCSIKFCVWQPAEGVPVGRWGTAHCQWCHADTAGCSR